MKNAPLIHIALRQKRELCGLSVASVVSKLKDFGIVISEKTLYAYENGTNSPKVNTFIALCQIYNVTDIISEFGYSSVYDAEQLEKPFLSCQDSAEFSKLYNLFTKLNRTGKGAALFALKSLLKDPDFINSYHPNSKNGIINFPDLSRN